MHYKNYYCNAQVFWFGYWMSVILFLLADNMEILSFFDVGQKNVFDMIKLETIYNTLNFESFHYAQYN